MKSFRLRVGKIVIEWIIVVKFRVNNGGGDDTGGFDVKIYVIYFSTGAAIDINTIQ